jgi:hypothetical protein
MTMVQSLISDFRIHCWPKTQTDQIPSKNCNNNPNNNVNCYPEVVERIRAGLSICTQPELTIKRGDTPPADPFTCTFLAASYTVL